MHGCRDQGRSKRLATGPKPVLPFSLTEGTHELMIKGFLSQIGTPRALAVWLIYEQGDHVDLLNLAPVDWEALVFLHGVDRARSDYAATKLLLKSDFLDLPIDRAKVAVDGGRKAETINRETNSRLRLLREGQHLVDHEFNVILRDAARIVADVMGPLDYALRRIEDHGWTPGRTSAVDSRHRFAPHKYQANLEVTRSADVYALALVNSSPMWAASILHADGPASVLSSAFHYVEHNTAITVPKNAKTDRLICYEPHLNIRLQRAVGVYLARRLKRVGINLEDQSPNQYLAMAGSRDGSFATLDLAMASDTLAAGLVLDLVPIDWYEFLDDLRSKFTKWPDGQISLNEKFSSMGNGFTFELETLCFYAICVAVSSSRWALVYGDDIVVFTHDYQPVVAALSKAGFSVNATKSFHEGNFRESCGEDFYAGVSVTVPHLDHQIKTVRDAIAFHNQVYSWLLRWQPHPSWARLLKRWRKTIDDMLRSRGYKNRVPLGPFGSGDGHFFTTFDEARPTRHPDGWDGYIFDSITEVPMRGLVTRASGSCDDSAYDRTTGVFISPWAILSTALGPKGSEQTENSIPSSRVTEKRSPLFSREWPSVSYTL